MPGGTIGALRALLAESRIDLPDTLPPMAAGVFGLLGYDTVRLVEPVGPDKPNILGVPDALLVRPTLVVVFDAVKDELTLVTPVRPLPGVDAAVAYARASERLTRALDRIDAPLPRGIAADPGLVLGPMRSNTPPEAYRDMVLQAKEHIAAGDIFQVVLSQRFSTPFALPPFALYRSLRRINPAPFLYFLDFVDFALVGSSPEILVRVRDGEVTIRPIAGTRPRGETLEADEALARDLLADPKERAEHLMLLDLGRNDVGRVAEIGSVRVTDSFFIERYSHVMHIVSNVTGRLAARHDAIDALLAAFRPAPCRARPRSRRCRSSTRSNATSAGLTPAASLFLRRRRHGHLHRAAHGPREGRRAARPGRRRHRRRQRSGLRSGRMRQQGPRADPRGGRGRALRRDRRPGAVSVTGA